jgi:uncharacterized protein YegJ (DUF2314 family)
VLVGYVLTGLRNTNPTHILRVNHKNPALEAAIKEARNGLDSFIRELQSPRQGEGFAIKGSFSTKEGPEYLWVRSPLFADGTFTGKLDQQPIAVPGKSKGDIVSVSKKDVVDWLIKDGQGIRGTFTEKVLAPQP